MGDMNGRSLRNIKNIYGINLNMRGKNCYNISRNKLRYKSALETAGCRQNGTTNSQTNHTKISWTQNVRYKTLKGEEHKVESLGTSGLEQQPRSEFPEFFLA